MKQVIAFLVAFTLASSLGFVAASRTLNPPGDFAAELQTIRDMRFTRDPDRPVAVVTGSSTVRLWTDAQRWLASHQVVNTGFGGSTMAQLLRHLPVLVLRFRPDVVFIAEGDNDLAEGKQPRQILAQARRAITRVHQELPDSDIVLVAAKPSLLRWGGRAAYEELNNGYAELAAQDDLVHFADTWNPLLDENGQPRPTLYRDDGLHLNDEGYVMWASALWRQLIRLGADPASRA